MNARLNAAQSHCLVSTWENTRRRTEEEACGLQKRPSVRRRNVTVVYITGGTTHTLQKLTEAEREKDSIPWSWATWSHKLVHCETSSSFPHCICPVIPPFISETRIHPSHPPFLFCLSFSLLLPLLLFPCLPQPSTMAIMTHLPVKLLPVETARPWHRTQCLSASL